MTDPTRFQNGDALLIVDMQNDFFPGGELPVEKGDAILPAVNRWIETARTANVPIYASRDWHPKDHVSFAEEGGKWPPHCVQDTKGAMFHPDLKLPDGTKVITKGVRFDRDQNSAFAETGLGDYLKKKGIGRLFICGLALDVCVHDSVMDAVKSDFGVVLISEGTRPVDPNGGRKALARMQDAGVAFTDPSVLSTAAEAANRAEADQDVCVKAPEWAEHERFQDPDLPCDDGRTGDV